MENKKKEQKSGKKLFYTIGSVVILILAALAFILIPALTQTYNNDGLLMGKWDGKPIRYEMDSYFAKMVEYYTNSIKQSGQDVDNSNFYGVLSNAFSSTVLNMAITEEVKESGFIAPDSQVNREMIPYFYDSEGKYSSKIFRDTPDSKKVEIKQSVIDSVNYQTYIDDYFGEINGSIFGIKKSSKEIPFMAKLNADTRSFSFVSFSTANYPKDEAAQFGRENPDLFNQYDFSVITLKTEDEAKKILGQINKEEVVFEDAVSAFSTKSYSSEDGKFSLQYEYEITSILSNSDDLSALKALSSGEVSGVVKTSDTFSIFRSNAQSVSPDFNETSFIDAAYSYLTSKEMGRIEEYFTNIAKDFSLAASRDGFDAACREFNIEKLSVEPFPLNYKNKDMIMYVPSSSYPELNGAETNENFLKTVFSLGDNEISDPIILGSNVLVLQLDKRSSEVTQTDLDNFSFVYPYYVREYDQASFHNSFVSSDKVENNVLSVFFDHFFSYE